MPSPPSTRLVVACALLALGACRGADGPPPLCVLKLDCPRPQFLGADAKMLCGFQVRDGAGGVVYNQSAGVELRKNPGLGFPKASYGVELRTAKDVETSANLLGMGGDGDWILDGLSNDRSLMRSPLVTDSFRQLGGARYAPEGRYCTLDLNGEPKGIYRLVEKVKRDDDRVNIAADDGSGRSFIVKQDNDGTLVLMSVRLAAIWELVYPRAPTPKQDSAVKSWLYALDFALFGDDPGNPTTGVFALLDLDATVDWILIEELSKNIDAYNRGFYFVRDGGRKARIVPSGTDLSFGQPTVVGDMSDPRNDSPDGWITQRPDFIQALGGIAALTSRLGPRWRALRAGPLSTAAIMSRLDGYGVTLTPEAIAQNIALWSLKPTPPDAGADGVRTDAVSSDATNTDAVGTDDGSADGANPGDAGTDDAAVDAASPDDAGTHDASADAATTDDASDDGAMVDAKPAVDRPSYTFYPVTDYAEEVAKLRAFIESRFEWIDAHIDGYPN